MNKTKKIAIMTSGGDAPGMNAAVRGAIRTALNLGWEVYGIKDAYLGLTTGGENIVPLDWLDVGFPFREGGTFLGSARYTDIQGDSSKARKLKEKALMNLKQHGISGLLVIGGDGSLTGAYELYNFLEQNRHTLPSLEKMPLSIIGIPGSIDNDIACTSMSIGVDTTLNTIVESIDKLRDTATSHKRISIVEVMGRKRGYLAVMSGLASGADRIFIGEEKISQEDLNNMLHVLHQSFLIGQKAGVIVRSEGASFSTSFLKEIISELLEPRREVRETVLGYLQRGGSPTAFERALATRMGVKATTLLNSDLSEPQLVNFVDNEIKSVPLKLFVKKVREQEFQTELSPNAKKAFQLAIQLEEPPVKKSAKLKIALVTDGNNVSGMNMALRAVARLALNNGIEVRGIKGGFAGLHKINNNLLNLEWDMLEMKGVLRRAGTLLGVSSNHTGFSDDEYISLKDRLVDAKIDGVILVGNLKTYYHANRLAELSDIPIVGIPADTNCNLPGTSWVIGMDSAMNDMVKGIDRTADAAHVKRSITLINLTGEYCRCLVSLSALSGGAEQVIIDELPHSHENLEHLKQQVNKTIENLKTMFGAGKRFASIVIYCKHPGRADIAIDLIQTAIDTAGIKLDTTLSTLAASYGGIIPTAFDRILAKRMGERAMNQLLQNIKKDDSFFHIVGISGKGIAANPYNDHIDGFNLGCPPEFVEELTNCFDLMAIPSKKCVGLGGTIDWSETGDETSWQGLWRCNTCGTKQKFSFNPNKTEIIHCKKKNCGNYGYIRSSRRL